MKPAYNKSVTYAIRIATLNLLPCILGLIFNGALMPGLQAAERDAAPLAPPLKGALKAGTPAAQAWKPAKPKVPVTLPTGPARAGWDAYVKNDFPLAEKAFGAALAQDGKDLQSLEGLRATLLAQGNYKDAQQINLQMILACPDDARCNLFISRTMENIPFVESRKAAMDTFSKATSQASPAISANLKDFMISLYLREDKPDEAHAAAEGAGYIDKWLFVAGPFGAKDKNNPIERRFAPERPLKTLDFNDPSPSQPPPSVQAGPGTRTDRKIHVQKDVPVPYREVNLDTVFQGAKGIFYAFTNLESDIDQDVVLGIGAPLPYRAYLRGMPIAQEPGDEQFRRAGGDMIQTSLTKGANPLLIKLNSAGMLAIRVLGTNYAPAKGVSVKPLTDAAMASHEVSSVRGFLMSHKTRGSLAEYFLKRYGNAAINDPPRMLKKGEKAEKSDSADLTRIAESAALTLPEAAWLDLAAEREGQQLARDLLAHRLAGSFPDSAGVLDLAASVLQSAGSAMGNNEAREVEEARQLREHALEQVPNSHQHLLGLYYFFADRDLKDQAFEKIKACVQAHPNSALATAELAQMYNSKQFPIEAERCFEKAASLDDVYLSRLIFFHESAGNHTRAIELRKKQIELGQLNLEAQYGLAFKQAAWDRAEELLLRLEKLYPERAHEWNEHRVQLRLEQGQIKEAYALEKNFYETQPHMVATRRGALLSLVDLALRLGKNDEARALLKEHLREHSADFEARQRLNNLESESSARWWEAYDVKVPQIDTSRYNTQNYPSANHAWIVDLMVTKILPDLSTESYIHIAQKVLNLQGINELSELLVRAQRNEMIFVRTLNPDGSAFLPQNVHDFNLAQSASLYKVGPGSILEHAYTMNSDADEDEPVLNLGFNFNAIDAPRAVSRWVVLIADEAKAKINIRKVQPDMVDEKILPGAPGFTVYQWTNKQVEGIKFEPFMPTDGDREVIPLITIETAPRPFRANAWLLRRERDFIPAEAMEQARTLVVEKADKMNDLAQLNTIVNWVRNHIQNGKDSRTLDDVWFSRSGNSVQMMTLAREMARSVGLTVQTAHINGAYLPGRVWHSKNAERLWDAGELTNFGSGGQALVLEQPGEPDHWVQFFGRNPKFYGSSELMPNQAGALALIAGDDGVRIKRVHGEALGLSQSAHQIRVDLDEKGAGSVQGVLTLFGLVAGNYREAIADPRQRGQLKEYAARHAWPKIQVKKVDIVNEEDTDEPLSFIYSGEVNELAEQAGDEFFIQPFQSRTRILDFRGPPERQNDLLVTSEWWNSPPHSEKFRDEMADLDQTLVYVAPEGFAWVEVPDDIFISTEFGFFLADYNVKGRVLTCTRSYLMPAQRVTPQQYPRLLDFLRQVSSHQQQRIAYGPLKAAHFGGYVREVFSGGYAQYEVESK